MATTPRLVVSRDPRLPVGTIIIKKEGSIPSVPPKLIDVMQVQNNQTIDDLQQQVVRLNVDNGLLRAQRDGSTHMCTVMDGKVQEMQAKLVSGREKV